MNFVHKPVMAEECLKMLDVKPSGIYVDCTAGGGGHSRLILDKLSDGRLIDIDKDEEALEACRTRFDGDGRVTFIHSDFKRFGQIAAQLEIDAADGILADLGLSSYQIDNPQRGFAYMASDAPLNMTMDSSQTLTASTVVNTYSEQKLYEIIRDYGEEKFAKNIARNIVSARAEHPVETCGRLVEIIDKSIPSAARRKGGHPAKRTFQALRIEVNKELDGLDKALRDMVSALKKGGRIAVITFHSLEDRIVKRCFADLASDCVCPPSLPVCVCGHRAQIKLVNKKPVLPSEEELQTNPRSASAKLRAAEKL